MKTLFIAGSGPSEQSARHERRGRVQERNTSDDTTRKIGSRRLLMAGTAAGATLATTTPASAGVVVDRRRRAWLLSRLSCGYDYCGYPYYGYPAYYGGTTAARTCWGGGWRGGWGLARWLAAGAAAGWMARRLGRWHDRAVATVPTRRPTPAIPRPLSRPEMSIAPGPGGSRRGRSASSAALVSCEPATSSHYETAVHRRFSTRRS